MWFYLAMGMFFIALGLSVHVFKWYFLISGYNTMSREKKARVDTSSLGRLIGYYSYANGLVFILMGLLQAWGLNLGLGFGMVFIAVSTIYLMIKSQKYDGNLYDEEGKLRPGAGKQVALLIGFMVAISIFVAVLLFYSAQPTKVTLLEEGIQIHGLYGDVYRWDAITNIRMADELPVITMRTNGAALGSKLKGHFRAKELGSVKLFVDADKPPFIYLTTDGGITIFNMSDAELTADVFWQITKRNE